ncbi:MAG: sensor histidine kinase [Thermoleophilaceae bacterium]|nr:sensor histidine kinase [Thermoleophilaceae bacterium]
MSWWGPAVFAFCSAGWALALAAVWTLRRRLARIDDAEHELRGAATAIGLAAEGELGPLLQLELDRMGAALADLAEARGARPAPPSDLEAGRLAQVLANVIANAAEHGVGPVEVRTRHEGRLLSLELSNRDRPRGGDKGPGTGRGRGVVIAKRAARELGGRVRVERDGVFTRTVVELPADDADPPRRRAA